MPVERIVNVVIILPNVEAMTYGIGSYMANLEEGVTGLPICLHAIKTQLKDIKEFTVDTVNPNVNYLNVPFPREKHPDKKIDPLPISILR